MREHVEKVHTVTIYTHLDTSIVSNSAKIATLIHRVFQDEDIKKKVEEPLEYFQILPKTSRLSL